MHSYARASGQKYSADPLYQSTNSHTTDIICNADIRVGEIRQFCKVGEEGQRLMRAAMTQLNLSARAYHCILKLARTTADLAGCEEIQSVHLAALPLCSPALRACACVAKALHAHLHCNTPYGEAVRRKCRSRPKLMLR